jgi:hypothetical protein
MRALKRLPQPEILTKKGLIWTNKFLNSSDNHPSSGQYAHKTIKEQLARISSMKCFYSEVLFAHTDEAQVDHAIEVGEDRTKAFEWENLYLSHKDCNLGKIENTVIPNSDCLDPFVNTDEELQAELKFEKGVLYGITERARLTIKKYKLNSDTLIRLRTNLLIDYYERIETLPKSKKKQTLQFMAQPDKAFSLMFYLKI